MLIAAKAMAKGIEVLKPHLANAGSVLLGTCIIGAVAGDLHNIGKNLVSMMIESTWIDMVDLGIDVLTAEFFEAIKENDNVVLVATSGLLTTTMPALKETLVTVFVAPSIFEQYHHLMGMDDCLLNFYEEPEEMHVLIDYLTEYELKYATELVKYYKADCIFHHDNWGSSKNSIMAPDMFEEFIVPAFKKIY